MDTHKDIVARIFITILLYHLKCRNHSDVRQNGLGQPITERIQVVKKYLIKVFTNQEKVFFFSFYFFFFKGHTCSIWKSKARGQIGAAAARLCHSNVGSKPHLQPMPPFAAMLDP